MAVAPTHRRRVEIRIATRGDVPLLRKVYQDAIRATGPQKYSAEQVAAWASFAELGDEFQSFILDATTYVAESPEGIVGFCGVTDDGHVRSVFVKGSESRRGIGSRLLAWALDHTILMPDATWRAEASEFSLPLFRKHGFVVSGVERVVREGVVFERVLVTR